MNPGTPPRRTLETLGKIGTAIETALLSVLLLGMIGLSTAQILLRNFFDVGFFWSDQVLRMLVLWIALAGAVAASRSDRHINISLIDSLVNERLQKALKVITHAFSAGICGLLTWVSLQFVLTSKEYGDLVLGSVPAWILQTVMPLGFGLICYRYVLFCIADLLALFGKRPGPEGA